MPTQRQLKMENEMTKDEIQSAIFDLNQIITAYCMSLGMDPPVPDKESKTSKQYRNIRTALEAQLTKTEENVTCGDLSNIPEIQQAETVDLEALKNYCLENMGDTELPYFEQVDGITTLRPEQLIYKAIDYIVQNYNITRKTK